MNVELQDGQEVMDKGNYHRKEGYEQDLVGWRKTGGKIKKYVENLFKSETQLWAKTKSLDYKNRLPRWFYWSSWSVNWKSGRTRKMILSHMELPITEYTSQDGHTL